MEKSSLFHLLRSLPAPELREVRKFLQSPFFNQRQDVIDLFEYLAGNGVPKKEAAWQTLFSPAPFDLQKIRLLMSYLHTLLEQYISVKEQLSNPIDAKLHLLIGYRKRGMSEVFNRVYKETEQRLDLHPLRNAQYHDWRYRLQWEAHQLAYPQNPTDVSRLPDLLHTADALYLSQKLRLGCLLAAHQTVYQSTTPETKDMDELVTRAERDGFAALPAVAIFLHCYRMLRYADEEQHFQQFKLLLLQQSGQFSPEEMHGFYILAVNYCIRQLNTGGERFFSEALLLYKEGLAKGYLFENGQLSRFSYHNIVAAGLQSGELDWVRYFIQEFKNRLEKRYRESSFSFNLARLEYAQKRYGSVLELLQKANYRDPLLNLAAKTLLLKTYYETDEYDLLQSHLDAMRNYLHRKRVIGYHRTNYLNIIRYTEKITRLNPLDKKAVVLLRQAIEQEEVLTEKGYLLKAISIY